MFDRWKVVAGFVGASVKKILRDILDQYTKSEEEAQRLDRFVRLYQNEDFKFFKDCIFTIRGFMANDLLSDRHTKLAADEKDIEQRAYKQVWDFLEFMLEPRKFARKTSEFRLYNKKQLEKIQPTLQGKKTNK